MYNKIMKKSLVFVLIILLGVSFVPGTRGDWWPMFGHDAGHTHYSTSTTSETNRMLWSNST